MREKQDLRLLREYVKEIITEDDGGAVAADLMGGAVDSMPYGMSYGGKSAASIFVEPFTDVFKVAAGKTKELGVRAQTLAKVAFEALVTSLIPIFSDDYAKIFADEKKKLENIKREYQGVYDAVWETFDRSDLKMLAFMYDPFAAGAMLTYFGGKAGASTAIEAVDALTGGWFKSAFNITAPRKKSKGSKSSGGSSMGGGTSDVQFESYMIAEGNATSEAVKKALEHPRVQQAREAAGNIVRETLGAVMSKAKQTLTATSLNQLVSGASASPQAKQALAKLQQVPEAERRDAEAKLMNTLKQSLKAFYVKNLEGQLKAALDSGVPQSSAFVRDYSQVISKIKAM